MHVLWWILIVQCKISAFILKRRLWIGPGISQSSLSFSKGSNMFDSRCGSLLSLRLISGNEEVSAELLQGWTRAELLWYLTGAASIVGMLGCFSLPSSPEQWFQAWKSLFISLAWINFSAITNSTKFQNHHWIYSSASFHESSKTLWCTDAPTPLVASWPHPSQDHQLPQSGLKIPRFSMTPFSR